MYILLDAVYTDSFSYKKQNNFLEILCLMEKKNQLKFDLITRIMPNIMFIVSFINWNNVNHFLEKKLIFI